MRYLSIDLEATGLEDDCYLIELALVPFCTETRTIEKKLSFHTYGKCPSFESLKPKLNPWVIEHNQVLIEKACTTGLETQALKNSLKAYLEKKEIRDYFHQKNIFLFGKSLSALDLPLMTRDFGSDFMRAYFSHKNFDLTSMALHLINQNKLPSDAHGSSQLMNFFKMGDVAHTALEDCINTIHLYFKILDTF